MKKEIHLQINYKNCLMKINKLQASMHRRLNKRMNNHNNNNNNKI